MCSQPRLIGLSLGPGRLQAQHKFQSPCRWGCRARTFHTHLASLSRPSCTAVHTAVCTAVAAVYTGVGTAVAAGLHSSSRPAAHSRTDVVEQQQQFLYCNQVTFKRNKRRNTAKWVQDRVFQRIVTTLREIHLTQQPTPLLLMLSAND